MLERKNRPKAISDKAKKLIIQYSLQNANEPRETIANILRREIKKLGERPPTLETLKKRISSARNRNPSSLDEPWHLGLMGKPEYDITPEAVPYILMVQAWAEKHPDMFNQPHEPITIRQALWVSRLHGQAAYLIRLKPKWDFLYFLFQWSEAYACRERICELSDTPFDTSGLDKGIIDGGLAFTAGESTLIQYRDGFSIDTIDKALLRQMEQMKKDGEK